ncbi:MAG: Electron transport complex subunit RsxA [Gammaproteobacteria bacterium]|nr:Electron transport complex subunit RsxA [Gammaproteobacteria bacterium]
MTTLFSTILAAALAQNLLLDGLLGLCPALALSRRHDVAAGMALLTLTALPILILLGYAIQVGVLRPLGAESLTLIAWALLLTTLPVAAATLLARFRPGLQALLGAYLPFFGFNCLVLGGVLLTTVRAESLIQAVGLALGTAAGYAIVLLMLSALRERLALTPVPAAMRGGAATLVTLGLLALALMGLRGIG